MIRNFRGEPTHEQLVPLDDHPRWLRWMIHAAIGALIGFLLVWLGAAITAPARIDELFNNPPPRWLAYFPGGVPLDFVINHVFFQTVDASILWAIIGAIGGSLVWLFRRPT